MPIDPSNDAPLKSSQDIFERMKSSILNIDPVYFCEENLTLDGKPFRLRGNGYKPFVDIYRYIGIQALNRTSKSKIVLLKGRQVGATTMGVNIELFFMGCGMFGTNNRPPMRVMHLFPQLDYSKAHAKTKLNPAITQSKSTIIKGGKTKGIMETMLAQNSSSDSLEFKEFQNGNHIWIESVGVDGGRVRGRTADCIFFDEVQDMFKRAILNATQVLNKSQYGHPGTGVQVYMGTPKSKDSVYYDIWMDSTQAFYYFGCEACGKEFPFYISGSDSWEKIWLEDFYKKCDHCEKEFSEKKHKGFQIRCPLCNHIQDKRESAERGKWVGKEDKIYEYVGFHINVLYMPEFDRETIMAKKPGISSTVDETTWQNEVLGEFYSGGNLVISAEEIRAKCADYNRKFRKIILPEECLNDRNVYVGCDWGKKVDLSQISKGENKAHGSEGQSYSCVVVLQVEGPQLFSIQFATKLRSNDRVYKMEFLEEVMKNYNVKTAVGDVGYAYDLMCDFQSTYGDRFVASEASGSQMRTKVKCDHDELLKTIRFEKDYYIEKLFTLLRAGAIRFPFGSWESVAWLVHHCSSMIVKPQVDKLGNVKIRYSKSQTPNDGLMSLINAYLAYEYDITNGFRNVKNISSSGYAETKQPLAIGAYVPRMRTTM